MAAPPDPNSELLVRARALVLDAYTGEVISLLRRAGGRCVVLKGPAIADWLYGPDGRSYVDIDLLVSPRDKAVTETVLDDEGFKPTGAELALPHGRRPHAVTWARESDGIVIDLHSTLPGIGVAPELVWRALADNLDTTTLSGNEVEILDAAGRALVVVLHAAHHGQGDAQPMEDLRRVLIHLRADQWSDVAALAERLEVTQALSAGLRLTPDGSQIADRLQLPLPDSVEALLRANSAPELALSLDWLLRTPGLWPRTRLIARRLFPPRTVLRGRSTFAGRGRVGLAAAYLLQPYSLARQAVPALRAWRAARKQLP